MDDAGNMIKHCSICDKEIKDGDRVLIGAVTTYHAIPSRVMWAVDPPQEFTFISHAKCEELE